MNRVISGAGAALVLLLIPCSPGRADAPGCSDGLSTVEMTRCVRAALEQKDRALQQAMAAIPREVANVPSATFKLLWEDTLTGFFKTSTNPQEQFEAFRSARLNACAFMQSLAFQGTGFGIFVTNCEIRLTDGLLEQLGR